MPPLRSCRASTRLLPGRALTHTVFHNPPRIPSRGVLILLEHITIAWLRACRTIATPGGPAGHPRGRSAAPEGDTAALERKAHGRASPFALVKRGFRREAEGIYRRKFLESMEFGISARRPIHQMLPSGAVSAPFRCSGAGCPMVRRGKWPPAEVRAGPGHGVGQAFRPDSPSVSRPGPGAPGRSQEAGRRAGPPDDRCSAVVDPAG